MPRAIMLIPASAGAGLTSISLGLIRAIERTGIRCTVFHPIPQLQKSKSLHYEISTMMHHNPEFSEIHGTKMNHIEKFISNNEKEVLMEEIIARYHACIKNTEIVLVESLTITFGKQFIRSLNYEIAKILNAEIILVMPQDANTLEQLEKRIKLFSNSFIGTENTKISGVILNKLNAPICEKNNTFLDFSTIFNSPLKKREDEIDLTKLKNVIPLPIFGAVPWNSNLFSIRTIDIAHYLGANVINNGNLNTRRVKTIVFCEHAIPHVLDCFFGGSLLVISSNRPDVLISACLAVMNGIEIGAILLTGEYEIDTRVLKLCKGAFVTGLPVFMVQKNIFQTFMSLHRLNLEISIDDNERIEITKEYIADYINVDWIKSIAESTDHSISFSPPAFRYHLTELARKAKKRIILPEGEEPRTVKAASICSDRNIASCVLLGNKNKINLVASSQGIKLGTDIEIIDPNTVRESYISRLVELRKNKGISKAIAKKQLEDNIVLGTIMLEKGEVDGLVSGAIHTTANTIRPPLQLIKTIPGSSLVSSIFFMLLPKQVYIYGDCAINPNPTAEQLAEIAIQSADSAIAFGIEPRVAMLSYSTGTSGVGSDVEKVREATRLAKQKRPTLIIDGPLQYDAAVMSDVAKFKAPNSPVAGRATVFIFPDLNTGNITYKAVQRSANLISIGPMLQGMRKPVNDLSRGALVNDIVYTIAITAIQATHLL